MSTTIIRDEKFEEILETLRREGGKSAIVARKAEEVIGRIRSLEAYDLAAARRMTRWGEYRIKKCFKYDLADGYRMVCQRQGNVLVLLYVGTHEECFRWIERNKGYQYDFDDDNGEDAFADEGADDMPPEFFILQEERQWSEAYEEELMKKIDEATLRLIFSGLCRERR
jgi:putative component of toxin-antitoxin plasmid stabilization module